jgi:uncharacterized BrkB/YihY/UPF0761 family membrane protein
MSTDSGKKFVHRTVSAADRWQRMNPVAGPGYGVIKKFSDDRANLLVVSLGWYGFTAIYPLLLVIVTIFGFVGVESLGQDVINTLHQFPVIGSQFNPGSGGSNLHGSVLGLIIGLVGLIYGAQGVTQVAQQAMTQVWNVPQVELPGFLPRLIRSLVGLVVIGSSFLVSAFVGSLAVSGGQTLVARILLIVGLALCNTALYLLAFWALTPKIASVRDFIPGAVVGGIGMTMLTTLGTGLIQHQLRNTTATYGAFASVIGVVTYLLLLGKLSIYAAELNPVLTRKLWPRALPMMKPTDADDQALKDLAHEEQRRPDQRIGVGFAPDPVQGAAEDASEDGSEDGSDESDGGSDGGAEPHARGKAVPATSMRG